MASFQAFLSQHEAVAVTMPFGLANQLTLNARTYRLTSRHPNWMPGEHVRPVGPMKTVTGSFPEVPAEWREADHPVELAAQRVSIGFWSR